MKVKLANTVRQTWLVVILLTAGCATTTPSVTQTSRFATPPKGQGRIVFYRPSSLFGYAQRADILLDGNKVGKSARAHLRSCANTEGASWCSGVF